jgi:hypothetical protein
MFAPIFATCFASAAVKAVLGSAPLRLYLFGEAEQATVRPYATWQAIGGSPENYINQAPDIDSFALQVDCWGTTAASARGVARAIRDAVEPHAHVTGWRGESKDTATGLYRLSFDLTWWTPR